VILDSWLDVVDADSGLKMKESKVKATFKIEINDEEKKVRDSTTTNQYHTGLANAIVMSKKLACLNLRIARCRESRRRGRRQVMRTLMKMTLMMTLIIE
jgi:hypothetical protein